MDPIQILTWNIFISIFLIGIGITLIFISILGFKYKNFYGSISTFVCGLIFLLFGIYNSVFGLFPSPYNAFFMIWVIIILAVFLGFGGITKLKKKEIPPKDIIVLDSNLNLHEANIINKSPIELDQDYYEKDIHPRMELVRKIFHLAGILLVVSFYGIGFEPVAQTINNSIYNFLQTDLGRTSYEALWGSFSEYPYTLNDPNALGGLTYFFLWCALVFVLIPDIIRILAGARYSLFNTIFKTLLRNKEYKSVGPQVFLILGVTASFFMAQIGIFAFDIVIATGLTSCISDALAAVVGRSIGRHKVKILDNIKSVEGFLAGVISAYLISMIFLGPIYAIFVALVFFLIDFLCVPIADNLLNPILLSLSAQLGIMLIGIPIGWVF